MKIKIFIDCTRNLLSIPLNLPIRLSECHYCKIARKLNTNPLKGFCGGCVSSFNVNFLYNTKPIKGKKQTSNTIELAVHLHRVKVAKRLLGVKRINHFC